jgi:hypothetical protein
VDHLDGQSRMRRRPEFIAWSSISAGEDKRTRTSCCDLVEDGCNSGLGDEILIGCMEMGIKPKYNYIHWVIVVSRRNAIR